MKLMRLLLIGLLSTVSILACGEDIEAPVVVPDNITIDEPTVYQDAPTVLTVSAVYEDTTLNKTLTDEPTWTIVPTEPSVEADFTLVKNILVANKSGAEAIITAKYLNRMDNKSIKVSTSILKSISVTPTSTIIIARKTNIQLKATATYKTDTDDQFVDVTSVTDWTVPTGITTITVDNIKNKGLVSATSETPITTITASFSGQLNTASVTALSKDSEYTSLVIAPKDITVDNGSLGNYLTATANYSPVGSIDVTELTTWVSAKPAIVTVENITNKGLVIGKADSGSSLITAIYGIHSDTTTVTSKQAPEFKSFAITGTGGNTVKIGATNQLQTVETRFGKEIPKADINSSDYVCTVASTVTEVTISGNCLIKGVTEISSVDILIRNNNADIKTETIQFKVTP